MEVLMDWAPLVAAMLVGLYAVGRALVSKMAADAKQDGWDKALATMQSIDPYIEKVKAWADPENPEVPQSPETTANTP